MFIFAIIYGGVITFIINEQVKAEASLGVLMNYCKGMATNGVCLGTDFVGAFKRHGLGGALLFHMVALPLVIVFNIIVRLVDKQWDVQKTPKQYLSISLYLPVFILLWGSSFTFYYYIGDEQIITKLIVSYYYLFFFVLIYGGLRYVFKTCLKYIKQIIFKQ